MSKVKAENPNAFCKCKFQKNVNCEIIPGSKSPKNKYIIPNNVHEYGRKEDMNEQS